MSNEALKSWLDAMPIDDVHAKIQRLETKLADLRVLERLYGERQASAAPEVTAEGGEQPQQWGEHPS